MDMVGDENVALSKKQIRSGKARSKIQESIDQAREEHKRELQRRRIELARQGVAFFQNQQMSEAVKAFHTYLKILEDWKGVPEGGIVPTQFDVKKDAPELLLIAAVYWDLAKLYDRTRSNSKKKEFLLYLEKYIAFSRGMPHQALAAETLRKYIGSGRALHTDEFKHAYKQIAASNCFIATSLFDVCEPETIQRLRNFRDASLRKTLTGRWVIGVYNRLGPKLAMWVDRFPQSIRIQLGVQLDRFSKILGSNSK